MIIRPFKSILGRKDMVELISAPPYDVVEYEYVESILRDNPYSFLHITRPEVELGMKDEPYDDAVYKKAKENFEKFIEDGLLIENDDENMFIYSLEFEGKVQRGIVATFSLDEYDNGKIKKHELTRENKELDRMRHILELNAQTGLVYLFYRSNDYVKEMVKDIVEKQQELFSFEADGVINKVHVVDEKKKEELIRIFETVDTFYIADGHHRAAAASRVRKMKMTKNPNHSGNEEYNYFLGALFPHDELRILPYNRLIKSNLNYEFVLKKLSKKFKIETIDGFMEPDKKSFIMTYEWNKWWLLKVKTEIMDLSDPLKSLDAFIFQEYVFKEIFGVKNPRKDERLKFIGGMKYLEEMKRNIVEGEYNYGFFLHPVSVDEIMKVADCEKIMPPKSTWFEPKLRSGLFIHPIF